MKTPKVAAPPPAPAPIPVPAISSPQMIDVQRKARTQAADRQGARASLLTSGGDRGDTSEAPGKKKRLGGSSSLAY